MERVKGIEPSYAAWEAAVLPLNYTRVWKLCSFGESLPRSFNQTPLALAGYCQESKSVLLSYAVVGT